MLMASIFMSGRVSRIFSTTTTHRFAKAKNVPRLYRND